MANTRPRIDTVARQKSRFSQKRSTTRPKAQTAGRQRSASGTLSRRPASQTVGRIRSASGALTRPQVSPVPAPQAPPPTAVTSPAPAPAAPPPSADDGGDGDVAEAVPDIDIAAIEAALAAIEAQFGLTREQLLADESEIGRTYRLLIAQVNRANEAQIESVLGNALDRGIVRSGIFAENVAEVETLTAESVADLLAQQGAKQGATQTAISQAEGSAAQAKLTAAQQRGADVLSLEELEALLKAGLA